MIMLLILLGVSISISVGFLYAFVWSVKDGQMDDTISPADRILFDNNNPKQ